ncbi:uncharacterized protein LOC119690251 [Teleopsis dalmanni]|uniref:uncharacterized protein LOC119690251 n=1 Tax=Teleopsis dalmanni TaxID=139649 RepID=UPI0018CFDA62|nr:uncharacterized protein LOC119690251 [Teleopsis dalmanni]
MENISSTTMESLEDVKQEEMVENPESDLPIPEAGDLITKDSTPVQNVENVPEVASSAVKNEIHKPLKQPCPERYNVDIKTVFPDFKEGEPLNIFLLQYRLAQINTEIIRLSEHTDELPSTSSKDSSKEAGTGPNACRWDKTGSSGEAGEEVVVPSNKCRKTESSKNSTSKDNAELPNERRKRIGGMCVKTDVPKKKCNIVTTVDNCESPNKRCKRTSNTLKGNGEAPKTRRRNTSSGKTGASQKTRRKRTSTYNYQDFEYY